MSEPKVAIAITADDKTAKGWSSAEKRAGRTIGKIGASNRDGLKEAQDGIARSSRGIVKSFSAIEQAGSRALSGGSIIGRAGAVRELGVLGRGLGATAAEAIGLEGALVGVTGAAVGLGAVAIAAGAAMWKLSDGWGKGANQLGNMASLIGVSTRGLQEFAGAAERVGVDKDTATGTLGNLSQTLNDARYGRNNGVLAMLGKLGVEMETNSDGTVNVEKMLPAIATAIAAQNSSGRRTAAHSLGISDAALAAFTQGGGALSADMADYGRNGAVITDTDTKLGRALTRRDTIGAQRLGKMWLGVQRANATTVKDVGDAAIDAVENAGEVSVPSPIGTAEAQRYHPPRQEPLGAEAGSGFAAERDRRIPARAGRLSRSDIWRRARHAAPLRDRIIRQLGWGVDDATAAAANAEMESRSNYRQGEIGGGGGQGLFQITDAPRKALFRSVVGVPVERATEQQQIDYLGWETRNREAAHWRRAHARGNDAANVADGFTRYIERPERPGRDAAERSAVAQAMISAIPVHVTVELHDRRAETRATVRAGNGTTPAISHAMPMGH